MTVFDKVTGAALTVSARDGLTAVVRQAASPETKMWPVVGTLGDAVEVFATSGEFRRGQLSMRFDPAQVPPGVNVKALFIARWIPDVGQWLALPTKVDVGGRRASAMVRHLSKFRLFFWIPEKVAEAVGKFVRAVPQAVVPPAPELRCQLPDPRFRVTTSDTSRVQNRLRACPAVDDVRKALQGRGRYVVEVANTVKYPLVVTNLPGNVTPLPTLDTDYASLARYLLYLPLGKTSIPGSKTWRLEIDGETLPAPLTAVPDQLAASLDFLLAFLEIVSPISKGETRLLTEMVEIANRQRRALFLSGRISPKESKALRDLWAAELKSRHDDQERVDAFLEFLDAADVYMAAVKNAGQLDIRALLSLSLSAYEAIVEFTQNVAVDYAADWIAEPIRTAVAVAQARIDAGAAWLSRPFDDTGTATLTFTPTRSYDRLGEALSAAGVGPFPRDWQVYVNLDGPQRFDTHNPFPTRECAPDFPSVVTPLRWLAGYRPPGELERYDLFHVFVGELGGGTEPRRLANSLNSARTECVTSNNFDNDSDLNNDQTRHTMLDPGVLPKLGDGSASYVNRFFDSRLLSFQTYAVNGGIYFMAISFDSVDTHAEMTLTMLCRLDHMYGTNFVPEPNCPDRRLLPS